LGQPHDLPNERETAVKQLLRRAAKRRRRAYSVIVRHGTETDANREFARDADNNVVWFFFALPAFMILHAICVKVGAI